MGWEFSFPGGPVLVSAIGPEADRDLLVQLTLAWVLKRKDVLPGEAAAEIQAERDRNRVSAALEGLLRAADTAQTVLIEHGYYDHDSRSEEAISVLRQFRFSPVANHRLHFFAEPVQLDQFSAALADPDVGAALDAAYLGYCVLRTGNPLGVVGRTMLVPPKRSPFLQKPGEFHLRVRTRVTEYLTLAGIPLSVEGVPFMQQEGAVTRCAHVGAWMAHYVAVLRGLTQRIPVADLYVATPASRSLFQRQYPSPGLNENQLVDALVAANLPPEVQAVRSLEVTDRDAWYHRAELRDGADVAWHREAFTTTICRYLNSGMPVLLARGEHVEVVCGYVRDSHVKDQEQLPKSRSGGINSLITCDDQEGPYLLRSVDKLLRDLPPDSLIITPMPGGLSLGGHDAEYLGATFIEAGLDNMLEHGSDRLRKLLDVARRNLKSRNYAVRSYAIEGNSFKQSFASRCAADPSAVRVVAAARLPKYVWAVEAVDRQRRADEDSDEPGPVVITAVLDATASRADQVNILLMHVPGAISVQDIVKDYEQLFECKAIAYESGRWAHRSPHTSLDPRLSKTCGIYS